MAAMDAHDERTVAVSGAGGDSAMWAAAAAADSAEIPARGDRIGRFLILEELGAGAVGVVLAAYDPELQRRIALKLLRTRGANSTKARLRLAREAQALARLDHPNVVTVYDVGIHQGQVFVAMTYVEGRTLAAWIDEVKDPSRSWREVVELFTAAGEGLVAAHEVGLVHRDFKPANVMVGSDGRPQVMDFGLALIGDLYDESVAPTWDGADEEPPELPFDSGGSAMLTATGTMLGTPAYMSPEQFLGRPATVLSDQFSFCVALHEAVYSQRPFAGEGVESLGRAVVHGQLTVPSTRPRAPRWLYAVMSRGLASDPEDRFPSLRELLAAIAEHDQRVRRRRRLVAVTGLGLVAAGLLGANHQRDRLHERACEAEAAAIAEVWSPSIRAEFERHLLDAAPDSAPLIARTLPWFDGHAASLAEASHEVCARETLREQWTPAIAAKARWCLDNRRIQLASTIDALAKIETGLPSHAISLATGFTSPAECLDEASLVGAPAPPSADIRVRVEPALERLAELRYLRLAGRPRAAAELAEELRDPFEALAWPPLEAELLVERALLQESLGEFELAVELGEQAYFAAATIDDWAPAASIASRLIQILGHNLARPDEASRWSSLASLAIVHAGDPLGLREARRLLGVASLQYSARRYPEARETYTEALASFEAALGPEHPIVAAVVHNLGLCYRGERSYDAALRLFRRQLDIETETYGAEHPHTLSALESIAITYMWLREFDAAVPLFEAVIAAQVANLGPDHIDVALSYNHLATVAQLDYRYADAASLERRSLAILSAKLEPDHPWLGIGHMALARAELDDGHPSVAEREARRAVEIYAARHGADSPRLAGPRSQLGEALRALGRHAEAFDQIERGLGYPRGEVNDEIHADLELVLAWLLWDPPAGLGPGREPNRARARELLASAERAYVELGVEGEAGLAALREWARAQGVELDGP